MQPRQGLAALAAFLLIAAGCGPEEPSADPADQDRIAELEASLAEAEARITDLEVQNEGLEEQLEAARDAGDAADDANGRDAPDEEATDAPDGLDDVAELRTAEGLIDQLRVHIRASQEATGLPAEWEPAVTPWVAYEVPDPVARTYDTPGDVVAALARAADAQLLGRDQWETTIRVLMDEDDPDLAYGAVLSWGLLDDAVRGRDVRITLTRTDDGQWEPGGAEQRFHCLRGLTDDGELCV